MGLPGASQGAPKETPRRTKEHQRVPRVENSMKICENYTERIQRGYRGDTARIQRGYREVTERIQNGYRKDTERIQGGYRENTEKIHRGYREDTERIQTLTNQCHALSVPSLGQV